MSFAQRLSTIQLNASETADKVTERVGSFMDKHGHHVRATANVGLYVGGCVTVVKSTTLLGFAAGCALIGGGIVGLGASAGEYAARSFKRGVEREVRAAKPKAAK